MIPKPVGHRVLVEAELPEEFQKLGFTIDEEGNFVTSSGIQLSGKDMNRDIDAQTTGRVIDVGATAFKDLGAKEKHTKVGDVTIVEGIGDPWCKVGDLVYYAKHVGKRVKDPAQPNRLLYVINDKDVVAVVEEV